MKTLKKNGYKKLLEFLERLREAGIDYWLRHSRDDAIMVVVYAPGEYWEIDFIEDGGVDVERYRSNGHIDDEEALDQLFTLWSDEEVAVAKR